MTDRDREPQRQDHEYAQLAKNYTENSDLHMHDLNGIGSSSAVKE